jgi:uncharacterized coiled-coil protein SlyX
MDRYEEQNKNGSWWEDARAGAERWLIVAVVALVFVAVMAFAYGYHERSLVQQLQQQTAATNVSMSQLQGQVSALTAKLNQASTPQVPASSVQSAAPTSAPSAEESSDTSASLTTPALPLPSVAPTAPKPAPAKRPAAKQRHTTVDKRYAQLQAQLTEQEKQLKETQEAVAKNREDLEGSIHSTRDELNGSIAKTHEELVALEKKGERSYFEFDLNKSKQFQRIGPITLCLRKADAKHKNFDIAMIVDDNELNKKKVNLYEPIWIHTENDSQPIQVVVNRIGKDLVHGYVSAPKYKPSELAAATSSSSASPVPANAPAQVPNSSTQTSPQPQ